jgi:anti-sigma B factor antagonist
MSRDVDLQEVHLLDVPVDVWVRATSHHEALQREFDIIRSDLGPDSLPHRLMTLIDQLTGRFGSYSDPSNDRLRAAAERGEQHVDVTFAVPAEASSGAAQLGAMLREVDEFCLTGHDLLTLATPRPLVIFREWFLEEFRRQIDRGLEPISWMDYLSAARNQTTDTPDADFAANAATIATGPHVVAFSGDLDLATANQLRNLIQEHRAAGATDVAIDLTEVRFIDSVGISLLVTTHLRMAEEGSILSFLVSPRLYPLLQLSGLTSILNIKVIQGSEH